MNVKKKKNYQPLALVTERAMERGPIIEEMLGITRMVTWDMKRAFPVVGT